TVDLLLPSTAQGQECQTSLTWSVMMKTMVRRRQRNHRRMHGRWYDACCLLFVSSTSNCARAQPQSASKLGSARSNGDVAARKNNKSTSKTNSTAKAAADAAGSVPSKAESAGTSRRPRRAIPARSSDAEKESDGDAEDGGDDDDDDDDGDDDAAEEFVITA